MATVWAVFPHKIKQLAVNFIEIEIEDVHFWQPCYIRVNLSMPGGVNGFRLFILNQVHWTWLRMNNLKPSEKFLIELFGKINFVILFAYSHI